MVKMICSLKTEHIDEYFWCKNQNFVSCQIRLLLLLLQIADINITEHIEGDECKFALWTGHAPISDYKIILKVSTLLSYTLLRLSTVYV